MKKTMNEHTTDELLSALVDDELTGEQQVEVLERLVTNPGLREKWGRYHTISQIINNGGGDVLQGDGLANSIRDRLATQVVAFEPRPSVAKDGRLPWVRPLVGLALAASVAAIAIVSVRPIDPESGAPRIEAVAQAKSPLRWDVSQPTVEARLNRYLVNHSEYMNRGVYGMHPYARIVGYQPRP